MTGERTRRIHNQKRKKKKKVLVLLAIWFVIVVMNIGVYVLSPDFLTQAGEYLQRKDELKKADVIVVFSGGDGTERLDYGIKLYRQKYAPVLVLSGSGTTAIPWAVRMKQEALQRGVPEQAILIEKNSMSTYENAVNTLALIQKKNWKTGILVTSPYHMRRALWVLHKQTDRAGLDIRWLASPADPSPFRTSDWWTQDEMRRAVRDEYIKLLYYYVRY